MENDTFLFSSLTGYSYGRDSAQRMTQGVAGNPTLAAGLLLGYFFLGAGSYIWAYTSQRNRHSQATTPSLSGQSGSSRVIRSIRSLISLFFFDTINAVTAIVLAVQYFENCSSAVTCLYAYIVWFITRMLATMFHFLSALGYLQVLFNPQSEASLRWLYGAVSLFVVIVIPVYIFATLVGLIMLGLVTIAFALAVVAKCASSTPHPFAAAQRKKIVLVTMITFLVVFAPTFILECLLMNAANNLELTENYLIAYVNALYFTNLQIFMDGILFYVVLLPPPEEQQQEQQHRMDNPNYLTPANVT